MPLYRAIGVPSQKLSTKIFYPQKHAVFVPKI